MDDSLESYRKAVINAFNFQYANLSSALQGCMTKFTEEAFAASMISESVMRSENFADMANEFKTGLKLRKTVDEIQTHCCCLIGILEGLDRPAAIVGRNLGAELSILASQYDLLSLLNQYGLSNEELEQECDDGLFIDVSQHMNDDYIAAGRCLNLSTERVRSISQIDKNDVQKKNEVLWTWKRKNGSAATYKELVKAFLKMEDRFVAESIMRYVSRKFRSSQSPRICNLNPQKAKKNWEELTSSEKEAVCNKLMDENHDVRKAYTVFVAQLIKSFKERKVDPLDIQSLVNSLSPLEHRHVQDRPIMFNFSKDDTISSVFSELTKHCSWFNYESLQVLVDILGNVSEKQSLQTYEDKHLVPYLNHSIFEIPCTSSQDQSQHTKLLLKVSADVFITGSDVKAIQCNLAKLLGFETSALLCFENYNEGCIELIFSLPTVIFDKSSPESNLFTYIEWDKSRLAYKVNIDVVAVLSYSRKPEVSLLVKLLQEKECVLNEHLEREKIKQKLQNDQQSLQEIVLSLSLQLREKEARNAFLTEKIKDLRSQILEMINVLKTSHPLLSHKIEEPLMIDSKQEKAYEILDKMKTLEDLTANVQEKEATGKKQEITKLLELVSSLTLQLSEKDNAITEKETDEEDSQQESLDNEGFQRETERVQWASDYVTLTSPTVTECKDLIHQLKRRQHTTWRIELKSISSDSLLTLLTNVNECPVRSLEIYYTRFDIDCVNELAQVVTYNKIMEELYLYSSPLLPDTYRMLTTALSSNNILKSLHLWYDNNITHNDIHHITSTNTTLEVLWLNYCPNVAKFHKRQIINALVYNKSLSILFINGKYLRDL